MNERARFVDLVGESLEVLSPIELRVYLAEWTKEEYRVSFSQFHAEAQACKEMAERQIRAVEVDGDDFKEWLETLFIIEACIAYARAVQVSVTMGMNLDPEAGVERLLPSKEWQSL